MLDEIIRSVTVVGLWSGAKRTSIHFIAKFSIICFLGVFILQLIALGLATDNLERLFECSSVTFFCIMGILKLYSLHFGGPAWLTILEQMKQLELQGGKNVSVYEYDSDDEGNPQAKLEYAKLKRNYEDKFKTVLPILRRIYRLTLLVFMTSPFFEYSFRSFMGDRPSKYPHILPAWTPLDDVHVAWYIIMVLIEAVAAVYCNCMHVSFDITFVGIITFVCGQYNILFDQCTRIGGRGHNSVFSRQRDERAHSRITYSYKTYIFLANAISTVDSLCKNIFGVYFLISTVTLCSIALRLKLAVLGEITIILATLDSELNPSDSGTLSDEQNYASRVQLIAQCSISTSRPVIFLNLLCSPMISFVHCWDKGRKKEPLSMLQMARLSQYASGILFQLYLCCTYGDEVLNASSINMGEGPFCSAIWCLSPKIRREIVLLSIGMSRLRRLRASPFNTVNRPSFVQITRAAYSCYAVVGQK